METAGGCAPGDTSLPAADAARWKLDKASGGW